MSKTNEPKTIGFTFTPHGHTTEEERSLYEKLLFEEGVTEEAFTKATKIATLEVMRSLLKGTTPDLNTFAWLLYEAGRIDGKQEAK